MIEVTHDGTPLDNIEAINAVWDSLRLGRWQRKIEDRRITSVWQDKKEIWIQANVGEGLLNRFTISGLDEKEGRTLRRKVDQTFALGSSLPPEFCGMGATEIIKSLAESIVDARPPNYTPLILPEVSYDQIPLEDMAAIVDELPLKYWERNFPQHEVVYVWHDKKEVWLSCNDSNSVLNRVVIAGLEKEEGLLLRGEFKRVLQVGAPRPPQFAGMGLLNVIRELSANIAESRPRRAYERLFLWHLYHLRRHFDWQEETVIETGGVFVPIGKGGLTAEDVTLLRKVYERLPQIPFDYYPSDPPSIDIKDPICPTCGGKSKEKAPRYKGRAGALKKLQAETATYEQEGLSDWMDARLKPGGFTRTAVLHADYKEFIRKHGRNRTDKLAMKDTALTLNKFGRLMVARFPRARRGTGKGYGVTLKRIRPAKGAAPTGDVGTAGG